MIAIGGPRFEEVKWCYENDEIIKITKIPDKDQAPL
jgi:hypothetical protein